MPNPLAQMLKRYRKARHERQFQTEKILTDTDTNQTIRQLIESGRPLMISRFGACELSVVNVYRQRQRNVFAKYYTYLKAGKPLEYTDHIRFNAQNNAGIFPPSDDILDQFAAITLRASRQIDVLGVWRFIHQEEDFWREVCPLAQLIEAKSLEPYSYSSPWSAALKGRRILVIHPFEESIQRQYVKRTLLFPSREILPEFDLKTIKAVQSVVGNPVPFASWVEALEFMKSQISRMEFDVALIGAGAYGLPLAAHVKSLGKQAVHMGGALQILFGIRGGRWDDDPQVSRLYNEHWVRPLPEETPQAFQRVEGGCYW